MARINGGSTENDPALFAVANEQLIPTVDATREEVVVNPEEQAAHLLAALSAFDTASLHNGYIKMADYTDWRQAQIKRYGKARVEKTYLGKVLKHKMALQTARQEFHAAYGVNALVNGGLLSAEDAATAADEQFELFKNTYSDEEESRRELRTELQTFYVARLAGQLAVKPETPQKPSPWVSEVKSHPVDPEAKVGLIHALRPGFLGLKKEDYQDIPDDVIDRLVGPDVLRTSLVDVQSTGRNAWGYRPRQHGRIRYITLGVAERELVLRSSPEKFAETAANKTDNSLHELPSHEVDNDKVRRSGNHSIEGIEARMQSYLTNVLEPNLALIARFKEAGEYGGNLARFGSEANMRAQMVYLWEYVVPEMLWTVSVARGGTRNHEDYAKRALEKVIFMQADEKDGLRNFQKLLGVLDDVMKAKKGYVLYKLDETSRYLETNYTTEERHERDKKRLQQAS